ncbi:MAG: T9SS type A sorting domain-containing protein [Ignavibacteriae bacterium]|nr:T9SS type A sorting domain-containing protein [Ignavibacteriota bacterium]
MGFDVTIRTMAVTSSGVVFAGTLGLGIYRSTDNGQWWQPVNSGLPIYTDVVAALAVNHQTNSIVAGFESSRVFLSTDNGSTWVGAGQPSTLLTSVVADDDGNLFVGTYGNGIYCSSNKGTSWRQFNDGLQGFDLYLSSIAGHSGRIYAGTYHGRVVESNGSEPWHSAETGISSPPVLNIESLQGDEIFVGAMGDVFRSTNIGESWETVSPRRDSTFVSAMKSLGGSRIIIGTENGDVFLSTDRGSSWTVAGNGLPRLAISCFALEPGGALYSSIGSYGIFRSTDFGGTWQRLGTSGLYPYVNAIEINAAGNIFAGSWQGIFLSTDKGSTWVQKDRGITYPSIYSLASNPNGTMIAGTTSSGIYRSTDNAESWIQTGSTGRSAYRLKYSNGLFFAATLDSGVYFSRDEGTTWQRISTGLDAGELRALGVDSLGFLWTSVYPYGGVYRTRTPLVTSIETSTSIQPSAFSLNQNYPNPFNPTTEIKYLIPEIRSQRSEVGHVTLKVYDLLGREVATLVNELQQPGAHSVRFDAVNLSSGVYLYRLVAGGYIQTRKMIVAK